MNGPLPTRPTTTISIAKRAAELGELDDSEMIEWAIEDAVSAEVNE